MASPHRPCASRHSQQQLPALIRRSTAFFTVHLPLALLLLLAASTASAHPTKILLPHNTIRSTTTEQHAAAAASSSSTQGTVPPMNPPVPTDMSQQDVNTEGPWPIADDADKFMVDFSLRTFSAALLTGKKPEQPGRIQQAVQQQPAAAAAAAAAEVVYAGKWPADQAAVMATIIQHSFEAEHSSSSSSSEGPWPIADDADQHIVQALLDISQATLETSTSTSSRSSSSGQQQSVEQQEQLYASAAAKAAISGDAAAVLDGYVTGITVDSTAGSTAGSTVSRSEDLLALYDEITDDSYYYYDDIIPGIISTADYAGDVDYLWDDLLLQEQQSFADADAGAGDAASGGTSGPGPASEGLTVTVITDTASASEAAAAAAAVEVELFFDDDNYNAPEVPLPLLTQQQQQQVVTAGPVAEPGLAAVSGPAAAAAAAAEGPDAFADMAVQAAAAAAAAEVQQGTTEAAAWAARSAAAKWGSSSTHHIICSSSSSSSSVRRLLGVSDVFRDLFRITPAGDDSDDDKPKKDSGTTPPPTTAPSLVTQPTPVPERPTPGPVTATSPAPKPQESPAPSTTIITPPGSSSNVISVPGNPGSSLPNDLTPDLDDDSDVTIPPVTGSNGTVVIPGDDDAGDDVSSSIDTLVPAKPLEPQPGELLPAGLQQAMQQHQEAATAPLVKGASVTLPVAVDTVTLSFIVRGLTPEAFTATYLPTVTRIAARLSGTEPSQWEEKASYQSSSSSSTVRPVRPAVSPSPSPVVVRPVASPLPVPAGNASDVSGNTTLPDSAGNNVTTGSNTAAGSDSNATSATNRTTSNNSTSIGNSSNSTAPASNINSSGSGSGKTTAGGSSSSKGGRRTLLQATLQQQDVLVSLSLLTANPQLVVFRLGQPAMDLKSALQLSCRDEFCYRLQSAGVPFEPSSITLEPDYDALFGRVNNGQVTSGDAELASRRRIAAIVGGAVAGGVVLLLLLLFIHKRRASCCCVGRQGNKAASKKMSASDRDNDMHKNGLPVKAPELNTVTKYKTAGELGGGGCSGSSSSRSVSRVGAGMPRSRLIKHAMFDPSSLTNGCSNEYVVTSSSDESPAAAHAIAAATAPVTVHSAVAAVTQPWPNMAAGIQPEQQQQQQRQLADVYFHADSFREWVAASSTMVNTDAGAASANSSSSSYDSPSYPDDDSAPRTPDSAALELAAALPASPISQPLYFSSPGLTYAETAGSSRGASSSTYAARQQQQQQQDAAAVKRLSLDQFKLLLGPSPDGSTGSSGQAVNAGGTCNGDLAVQAVHAVCAGSTSARGKAVQALQAAPGGSWPLLHDGSSSSME